MSKTQSRQIVITINADFDLTKEHTDEAVDNFVSRLQEYLDEEFGEILGDATSDVICECDEGDPDEDAFGYDNLEIIVKRAN